MVQAGAKVPQSGEGPRQSLWTVSTFMCWGKGYAASCLEVEEREGRPPEMRGAWEGLHSEKGLDSEEHG